MCHDRMLLRFSLLASLLLWGVGVPLTTSSAAPVGGTETATAPATVPAARDDFALELDEATFDRYASRAPGIRAVKLLIDRRPETVGSGAPAGASQVYFLNSSIYELHIQFVQRNKLVPSNQARAVQLESWRSDQRRFIFALIARYEVVGGSPQTVVELFDEDQPSASVVAELMQTLSSRARLGPVAFKPNSLEQESLRGELERRGISMLRNDALSTSMVYQVVHAGLPAVGRLRVVAETDPAVVESMVFNRDEIVLLQAIPNDITRVAGVITTRPTTPLSHVSLRARTWNIPNVMLREALTVAYKEGLEDAWVHLSVTTEGYPELRRATLEEVEASTQARKRIAPDFKLPRADLAFQELIDLFSLRRNDIVRVGAKAANLGELAALTRELPLEALQPALQAQQGDWLTQAVGSLPRRPPRSAKKRAETYLKELHVPPGFAIPFSAYQAFLDHAPNQPIRERIGAMLTEERFQSDAAYRKSQLDALQEQIRNGAFPPDWGRRILDRVHSDLPDRRLFVRSSTNSEDLEGFNGAGLYETVGNVEGDEAILSAIKRVWASIWNFKAYEARADFGIDHRAVYPAILIQEAMRPFAAGVLVTQDVLNPGAGRRFYLNANPGLGENTVNAGRGLPEQIYGDPVTGRIQRISLSERGGNLLSDKEVQQLVFFSAVVEAHFANLSGQRPYPQDIEWLIVNGRISLVQTRPYLAAGR